MEIRSHRIYLYRDVSNDQVIGIVKISHKYNPLLNDKTNREGLIVNGFATNDFIKLLQMFLVYIRKKPYSQYQTNNRSKNTQRQITENQLQSNFDLLKDIVKDNKVASQKLAEIEKGYNAEKQFLTRRAEMTENLAGVGLSVETASHDIMRMMDMAFNNIDSLISDLTASAEPIDRESLLKELNSIRGSLGFVHAQLKDIQLLFTSSKQRRKKIVVRDIVNKVEKIYRNFAKKSNIQIKIEEIPGSPLVATTTDAVLLQVLLNLFGNAIFWLNTIQIPDKQIIITLDGMECKLIFSDNGPGVKDDDLPYIFEPFYSGKGEEGRGLGLYIARQLLERYDYTIDYATLKDDKKLPGANFVVMFISGE